MKLILALVLGLSAPAYAGDMTQGGGSSTPGISTGAATTAALTGNGQITSPLGVNSSSVAVFDANRNLAVPYGVTAATAVVTYIQTSSITTTGNLSVQGTGNFNGRFDIAGGSATIRGGSGTGKVSLSQWTSVSDTYGRVGFTSNADAVSEAGIISNGAQMYLAVPGGSSLYFRGAGSNVANFNGTSGALALTAPSGEGTSVQSYLDLSLAGYGPTSGAVNWIGNVGNVSAYWADATHRFYVNATGSGVMEITAPGVIIGAGTAIAKVQKVATASTDLGAAITATCTAETNFAITGVAVGDSCTVTTPAAIAASDWIVCRTLLDNVALKYCTQGAAVDPAAMVYHITTIEY